MKGYEVYAIKTWNDNFGWYDIYVQVSWSLVKFQADRSVSQFTVKTLT
jgi:hypothetical protein